MTAVMEQAAFDIDSLIEEVNPTPERPPFTGRAPLHFTVSPFTVEEFTAAEDDCRERHGIHGMGVGHPHIWFTLRFIQSSATPGHAMVCASADLGCDNDGHLERFTCQCVGGRVYRVICECRWNSDIYGDEGPAVEAWHDHAWPEWRILPALPRKLRPVAGGVAAESKPALSWMATHYPDGWGKPGAPIVTERDAHGTRHVPGYSPWGGFDLSSTALETGGTE